jgi:predicted nucleic acid-binding protein
MRIRPEPVVSAWLDSQPEEELWTSSIVIAELLSGIDLMPVSPKQRALREAVEDMIAQDFGGRILKFDMNAARHYGEIFSHRQQIGRPIKQMDGLILATAKAHGATLATRNIPDFEHCGVPLVNPWQAV